MTEDVYSVAGDEAVGYYRPPLVADASWPRVSDDLLDHVRALPGAVSTASDILDEFGLDLVAYGLEPRSGSGVVVGHVLTATYLPERRALSHPELRHSPAKFIHHSVFEFARPGDVVVIDARGLGAVSVLGGIAASAARAAEVSACIVDGGVRDIDEIREIGLAVWSRAMTPRTGKWRLEGTAINQPVMCGGVHVEPGDVAVADDTGVCFIPANVAESALRKLVEISERERLQRSTSK